MARQAAREELMIDYHGDVARVEAELSKMFRPRRERNAYNLYDDSDDEDKSPEIVEKSEETKEVGGLVEDSDDGELVEYLNGLTFRFVSTLRDREAVAMSYGKFVNYLTTHGSGYEVLGSSPIRPMYDYEEYFTTSPDMIAARLPTLHKCRDTLTNLWRRKLGRNEVIIDASEASGFDSKKHMWKLSFHFVVSAGVAYESGADLKRDGGVPDIFDPSVYSKQGGRQLWRPVLSSKAGQKRALKPIDVDTGEPEYVGVDPSLWVWRHSPQVVLDCEVVQVAHVVRQEMKGTAGELSSEERERIENIVMALKQDRADDRDKWIAVVNALANIGAVHGEDMSELIHKFSARSKKYQDSGTQSQIDGALRDADGDASKLSTGSLVRWLKDDVDADTYDRITDPEAWAEVQESKGEPDLDEEELELLRAAATVREAVEPCLELLAPQRLERANTPTHKKAGEWVFDDWRYFLRNAKNVRSDELHQYFNDAIIHAINGGRDVIMSRNRKPDGSIEFMEIDQPFRGKTLNSFYVHIDGSEKSTSMDTIFRQHYLYNCYNWFAFHPYLERNPLAGTTCFNMFGGWRYPFRRLSAVELEEAKERLRLVLGHVQLLAGEQAPYVLQWIGHIFQQPTVKPGVCLVFKSDQGAGKNIFWEWIMRIMGNSLCNMFTDIAQMAGKFNTRLKGKMLNIGNELANYSGFKVADKLKAMITDKKLTIEPKGKEAYDIVDLSRMVLMTNNEQPVRAEVGDRRFLMMECSGAKIGDKDYFTRLAADMDRLEVDMWNYITNISLEGFDPHKAPKMTGMKRDLIINNAPAMVQFMIALGGDEISTPIQWTADDEIIVSNRVLYDELRRWVKENIPAVSVPGPRVFVKQMSHLGIKKKKVPKHDGKQMNGYRFSRSKLEACLRKTLKDDQFSFEG